MRQRIKEVISTAVEEVEDEVRGRVCRGSLSASTINSASEVISNFVNTTSASFESWPQEGPYGEGLEAEKTANVAVILQVPQGGAKGRRSWARLLGRSASKLCGVIPPRYLTSLPITIVISCSIRSNTQVVSLITNRVLCWMAS